jgi:hypothetical protein
MIMRDPLQAWPRLLSGGLLLFGSGRFLLATRLGSAVGLLGIGLGLHIGGLGMLGAALGLEHHHMAHALHAAHGLAVDAGEGRVGTAVHRHHLGHGQAQG